jgi:flagellar hook-basal body complex protein FliE
MSSFGIEGGTGPAMRGTYASLLGPRGVSPQELRPQSGGEVAAPDAQKGAFGGALADAIQRVDSLQSDVASKTQALAMGENVALHDVMTSMGKSEVAFNLVLEVRNRLVDAWEKLSRSVV